MPYICEKLWATSLTLNLATNPSRLYLTLNTYFDLIAFLPDRSLLYTYVWWFSKFCSFSSIASCHCCPWIGSLVASLYNFGLCILLLDSIIDITISHSFFSLFALVFYAVFADAGSRGVSWAEIMFFYDLSLSLGSLAKAFFFKDVWAFNGQFASSFALFFNLSIYGLLTIMTCLVCGAQISKCLVISELYPINILSQTF